MLPQTYRNDVLSQLSNIPLRQLDSSSPCSPTFPATHVQSLLLIAVFAATNSFDISVIPPSPFLHFQSRMSAKFCRPPSKDGLFSPASIIDYWDAKWEDLANSLDDALVPPSPDIFDSIEIPAKLCSAIPRFCKRSCWLETLKLRPSNPC